MPKKKNKAAQDAEQLPPLQPQQPTTSPAQFVDQPTASDEAIAVDSQMNSAESEYNADAWMSDLMSSSSPPSPPQEMQTQVQRSASSAQKITANVGYVGGNILPGLMVNNPPMIHVPIGYYMPRPPVALPHSVYNVSGFPYLMGPPLQQLNLPSAAPTAGKLNTLAFFAESDDDQDIVSRSEGEAACSTRIVILEKNASSGYGFYTMAYSDANFKTDGVHVINFEPSDSIPAITYIQSVDKGSFADLAKLTAGDHIVEVNGVDVTRCTYDHTISLMKSAGDKLTLVLARAGVASSMSSILLPPQPSFAAGSSVPTQQEQKAGTQVPVHVTRINAAPVVMPPYHTAIGSTGAGADVSFTSDDFMPLSASVSIPSSKKTKKPASVPAQKSETTASQLPSTSAAAKSLAAAKSPAAAKASAAAAAAKASGAATASKAQATAAAPKVPASSVTESVPTQSQSRPRPAVDALKPIGGLQRPSLKQVDETAVQCITALAADGQLVTLDAVISRLCDLYQVRRLYDLGIRPTHRGIPALPRLEQLDRDQSKVNAYCDAFNYVNAIGTLHDMGRNIARLFGKEKFDDLLLGPLHKQPKLVEIFQFPSDADGVPTITTMELLKHFQKYLRKNPRGASGSKLKIEDFMTYIQEQYKTDSLWHLGIQIKSLGLVISSITNAGKDQQAIATKFRAQLAEELMDDLRQSMKRIRDSLIDRLAVAGGGAEGSKKQRQQQLALERQKRFADMDVVDVITEMFNAAQQLFADRFRRTKLQNFFQSILGDPVLRNMFQVAICGGRMELPEDINDDDDEMSVGDDEATSESAIAEFHAPSSEHLVAAFRELLERCHGNVTLQSLSTIEERLLNKYRAASFSQLTQTTYMAFLFKHSKIIEDIGGAMVSVGGVGVMGGGAVGGCRATRDEIAHFIQQCGCLKPDSDEELQLLSAALCTHYAVGDVRELGVGQLKRFIKTESAKIDARKHATSSVYYATAACLDSRYLSGGEKVTVGGGGQVGLRGDKSATDALRAIASTPLMLDVSKWTHWKLVFEPQHGDLKTFLQIHSHKATSLDLTVAELEPGCLVKISRSASGEAFKEAVDRRKANDAVGQLVSLICVKYGNVAGTPAALLANHVYQSLAGGRDDADNEGIVRFVHNCLLLMPDVFHRAFSQQVFVEPLARVLGMRESYQRLWQASSTSLYDQCQLERVGLLLGIADWCKSVDVKFGANSSAATDDIDDDANADDANVLVAAAAAAVCDEEEDIEIEDASSAAVAQETVSAAGDDVTVELPKVESTQSESAEQLRCDAVVEGGEETDKQTVSESGTAAITTASAVDSCRAIVEKIRQEKFGIGLELSEEGQLLTKGLKELLGRSLDRLSKELYSRETHFVLELIQNADDNEYDFPEKIAGAKSTSGDQPTAVLIVESECIVLLNNEKGFREKNIKAICDVGQTTKGKHKQGYIGQKGIGFKSIFTVTDRPEVHSAGYHICFDAKSGPIGYILPQWLEEDAWPTVPESKAGEQLDLRSDKWTTQIVLPLKDRTEQEKHKSRSLTASFRDIHPSLLLFLNRLKSLVVINQVSGETRVIRRRDVGDNVVEIRSNDESERWLVVRKRLAVPSDLNPDVESTELALAFPMKKREDLVRALLPKQEVFAFLPLRNFGFNFIVQADFEIPSSRQDVYRDSQWNQWLRDQIPHVFVESLAAFKAQPTMAGFEAVRTFMQFVPLDGEVVDFFQPIPKQILQLLAKLECLPVLTASGIAWKRPSEVVDCKDAVLREVMTPDILQTYLNFYYLHPSLKGCFTSQLLSLLGVQKLTPNQAVELFAQFCNDVDFGTIATQEVARWLASFAQLLHDDLSQGHHELLDKLRALPIFPLSSGQRISLKSSAVFFPLKAETRGSRVAQYLQPLYQDLCTISTELYTTDSEIVNSYVKRFLQELGVKDMVAQQVIAEHILPALKGDGWKEKSRDTLVAFVVLLKQEWDKDKRALNLNDIRSCIILSTSSGLVRLCDMAVNFTTHYGNEIDLRSEFPDLPWVLLDSVYLSAAENEAEWKTWRHFFSTLGVADFLKVKKVATVIESEDFATSSWGEYLELLPQYGTKKYIVEDFVCDEFEKLVDAWHMRAISGTNVIPQAANLFTHIANNWTKQYISFRMAHILNENEHMLKEVPSSFYRALKQKAWIASYKDEPVLGRSQEWEGSERTFSLLTPNRVFYASKQIEQLLGIHESYLLCKEVVTGGGRSFVEEIGVHFTLTIEDVVNYLLVWSAQSVAAASEGDAQQQLFCTSLSHTNAVYHYLSENYSFYEFRNLMNQQPLIFVPNEMHEHGDHRDFVVGAFYRIQDTCWSDPTGIVAAQRPTFVRPDTDQVYKRVVLQPFYSSLHNLFIGNDSLNIFDTPTAMEYATLLVDAALKIDLPSPTGLATIRSLFDVLGQKCMSTSSDIIQGGQRVILNMSYVGPLKDRLKDEPIIPTHRHKFVTPLSCPLIPDDAFTAELLKSQDEQKVHLVDLGDSQSDDSMAMVFLTALGIRKLSECEEKEAVTQNMRLLPQLQLYLSNIIPYVQMYLLSRPHLRSIYDQLLRSGIAGKLQALICYESPKVEVVHRVTTGPTDPEVVIVVSAKCSLDQQRHFCVHSEYRSNYQVINGEFAQLFISDPTHRSDVASFMTIAKMFVVDNMPNTREEFMTSNALRPLPTDEAAWVVTPPIIPVTAPPRPVAASSTGRIKGELTETEELARRKTRKQEEGDDDNALRSWPPPRPQPGAVSRGGEGNKSTESWPKPPPSVLQQQSRSQDPSSGNFEGQGQDEDAAYETQAERNTNNERTSSAADANFHRQESRGEHSSEGRSGQRQQQTGGEVGGSRGGDGGEFRPPTEDATRAHDGPHGQASSNLRPHVGVDDSQHTGSPLEGVETSDSIPPSTHHHHQHHQYPPANFPGNASNGAPPPRYVSHGMLLPHQWLTVDPSQLQHDVTYIVPDSDITNIPLEQILGSEELTRITARLSQNGDSDAALGRWGEEWVFEHLKVKFSDEIAANLLKVIWMNEAFPTLAPYDVRIEDSRSETVECIEVKTTGAENRAVFEISYDELVMAQALGPRYHIYRVYVIDGGKDVHLRVVSNVADLLKKKALKLCMVV